jgi:hypothetical protein
VCVESVCRESESVESVCRESESVESENVVLVRVECRECVKRV